MAEKALIYCVEDDESIRELIVYALRGSGFEAQGFEESGEFYQAMAARMPQLVLLDLMLPGEDGLSILARLRGDSATAKLPVIILTAKDAEYDKVRGLDGGADDYVTKPFGVMELLSRIKALLRRAAPAREQEETRLVCGEIVMDVERRTVTVAGTPCTFSFKEFELLRYLMENQGIVLSRDKIMRHVWGVDFEGESRTVEVHIKFLRQKLGEHAEAISTVRGVGYKLG